MPQPTEFQILTENRDRQFTWLTIVYLIVGVICLFLKTGDAEQSPAIFLTHGAVVLGVSLLYLVTVWMVLRFYDGASSLYSDEIPKTEEDIVKRAVSIGLDIDIATRQANIIRKSTGYAKLLGITVPVYSEIRFLRDFARIASVFIFVIALNMGWENTGDFTLPALSLCAAVFLWISSVRYQATLNFLQSLTARPA